MYTFLNWFNFFPTDEITHPQVLEEFQILQKSLQQRDAEVKESFWRSLREPEVHKPLIILMSLFAFQQLTGIFVVIVFAVQISSEVFEIKRFLNRGKNSFDLVFRDESILTTREPFILILRT